MPMTRAVTQSRAANAFRSVRSYTERLCKHLTSEDQCIQSMPDASPAKWHRAHTTWFFEQFVLVPYGRNYQVFSTDFAYLFNSYYVSLGDRQPRFARGIITRPGADEVTSYRAHVDAAIERLLDDPLDGVTDLITLGLHHEQQHQELLVTDMLHGFSQNPLHPIMNPEWREQAPEQATERFICFDGGLARFGHDGNGFAFDNEGPAHTGFLPPFRIAATLVRNSAWLDFMAAGGYRTPSLWMSEGWAQVQESGWQAPMNWRLHDGAWYIFTPGGEMVVDPEQPVRHVSWYEADAFARWAGARLPTEFEWEAASQHGGMAELDSHVWQWTGSAYLPHPGFRAPAGAVGEYNGRFMIDEMVLRGGS